MLTQAAPRLAVSSIATSSAAATRYNNHFFRHYVADYYNDWSAQCFCPFAICETGSLDNHSQTCQQISSVAEAGRPIFISFVFVLFDHCFVRLIGTLVALQRIWNGPISIFVGGRDSSRSNEQCRRWWASRHSPYRQICLKDHAQPITYQARIVFRGWGQIIRCQLVSHLMAKITISELLCSSSRQVHTAAPRTNGPLSAAAPS